ncbi:MAG: hypothetical protein Tsb009_07890 [Planctomycetaceae bacterium]
MDRPQSQTRWKILRPVLLGCLLLGFLATPMTANAQRRRVYRPRQVYYRWYRTPVFYYPYGFRVTWTPWYGYRWSISFGGSSLVDDYYRGVANVIRAQGQLELARSRAILNYQQARSQYIQNQQRWNEVYQERVRLLEEKRRIAETKREERVQKIQERRKKYQQYLKSKTRPRMTASQLDPYTGKIFWPEVLQSDDFRKIREEIDEWFVIRAHTGTISGTEQDIDEKIKAMSQILKTKIRELPTDQYITARSFLELLSNEIRHANR